METEVTERWKGGGISTRAVKQSDKNFKLGTNRTGTRYIRESYIEKNLHKNEIRAFGKVGELRKLVKQLSRCETGRKVNVIKWPQGRVNMEWPGLAHNKSSRSETHYKNHRGPTSTTARYGPNLACLRT